MKQQILFINPLNLSSSGILSLNNVEILFQNVDNSIPAISIQNGFSLKLEVL